MSERTFVWWLVDKHVALFSCVSVSSHRCFSGYSTAVKSTAVLHLQTMDVDVGGTVNGKRHPVLPKGKGKKMDIDRPCAMSLCEISSYLYRSSPQRKQHSQPTIPCTALVKRSSSYYSTAQNPGYLGSFMDMDRESLSLSASGITSQFGDCCARCHLKSFTSPHALATSHKPAA